MSYTNTLVQKVYSLLEPLIGASMAAAALTVQFKRLGIAEDTLGIKDLPALAAGIEKGLIVFLGSDSARGISQSIAQIA
ncbi:MAG: hypothetical protein ACMUIS_10745 [bacterium]